MISPYPGDFVYPYTFYRVLFVLRVYRVAHHLIFELELF